MYNSYYNITKKNQFSTLCSASGESGVTQYALCVASMRSQCSIQYAMMVVASFVVNCGKKDSAQERDNA